MGLWLFRTLEKMMAMRETAKLRPLEARTRRFAGSCHTQLISNVVQVCVTLYLPKQRTIQRRG